MPGFQGVFRSMGIPMKYLAKLVTSLVLVLLAGCGGGADNRENESGDQSVVPRVGNPINMGRIGDSALRACIDSLMLDQQWQVVEDVEAIHCPNSEVLSIVGLDQFPNLRVLEITAPRLPETELDMLAALPLDDFQRAPYYLLSDESSASYAVPAVKILLNDGNSRFSGDDMVNLLVLVSDDPRRSDSELSWTLYSVMPPFNPGEPQPEPEPEIPSHSQGNIQVGATTTLYWLRARAEDASRFYAVYRYDGEHQISRTPAENWTVERDQDIADVYINDSNLRTCIQEQAQARGWTRTSEFTHLQCPSRDIENTWGLEQFSQLQSVDLSYNFRDRSSVWQFDALHDLNRLTRIDLTGILLRQYYIQPLLDRGVEVVGANVLQFPAAPEISLQPCGIHIDNFDPSATYAYTRSPDDWLSAPDQRTYWEPGEEPDCMPLAREGEDEVWSVFRVEDNVSTSASTRWMINPSGELVQLYFSGNYFTHYESDSSTSSFIESSWTIPGNLLEHFYTIESAGPTNMVIQRETATWKISWRKDVGDLWPIVSDSTGVYLINGSWNGESTPEFHHLSKDNVLRPLPIPSMQGRPSQALVFDGELWVYGISDAWGGKPDVWIWNQVTQQWRHQQLRSPAGYYALRTIGADLCAEYRTHPAYECFSEASNEWTPMALSDRRQTFQFFETTLSITPPNDEYYDELYFGALDFAYFFYSHRFPLFYFGENRSQLQSYNQETGAWEAFGPMLLGYSPYGNFLQTGNQLNILFSQSIVRLTHVEETASD